MSRQMLVVPLLASLLATPLAAAQDPRHPAPFEAALHRGELAEAERTLGETLGARPGDDEARFALGVVQFLGAVEGRMQALYRHGCRTGADTPVSFSNLPIGRNPKPEPLTYQAARGLLQAWVDDLARAEATLSGVKAPGVKLPLHFGLIRLDFDGDGKAGEAETLWKVYGNFNRRANVSAEGAKGFVVALDRGDVDWLRGYCHVLAALTETLLAHDFEVVFTQTGHLMFEGVKVSEPSLAESTPGRGRSEIGPILDLVAMVHLIRLPVVEPRRLGAALAHMEAMIALSRSSWRFILAEVDDDREWVPSPRQKSVVPGVQVSAEMVEGWTRFLDELESLLAGKTLAPFWRGDKPRPGVNVRRVFLEPRELDLILWARGSAAAPYLERGEVSSAETWSRLNRVFGGEFIGFALWFN